MTRKEKKEELIGLFSTGAIFIGDLIDECFEFADAHPHWISVEDELPKEDGIYLLYDEASGVYTSAYYVGFAISGSITHWMPMPALPEHIAGVSKMIGSSEKPNNCKKGEEIKGNQGEISPNKEGGEQ